MRDSACQERPTIAVYLLCIIQASSAGDKAGPATGTTLWRRFFSPTEQLEERARTLVYWSEAGSPGLPQRHSEQERKTAASRGEHVLLPLWL